MRKNDKQLGIPYQEFTGSKASIEALPGLTEGCVAYASDTNEFGSYNGATWTWGSGGGGHVRQEEGTPLTARANLNFVGAGVTATDDAGNNATVVTISGGGSSSIPIVTVDPVAPADGDLWLLRETVAGIADGVPIGLLLALTYTGNSGATVPLKLSVNDNGTTRRLNF